MSVITSLLNRPYLAPFLLKTKLDDWLVHPNRNLVGSNLPIDQTSGHWEMLKDFPSYRYEFGGTYLNNKIYVIGGLTMPTVYTVTSLCEAYDTTTQTWSRIKNFPKIIHHPSVVAVKDKLYVVGGNGIRIHPYSSTFEYDPTKNIWTEKKNMPTARGALAFCAIDDIIYAVGGGAHKIAKDSLEAYNPTKDLWAVLAPMPTKREHLAAAACNGLVFALGGYEKSLAECLNTNEAYNPKTNAWETRAPIPMRISGFSACSVGDSVFIFGGEQGWAVSGECLEYKTKEDKWYRRKDLPTARYASIAVPIDGKIHVLGGNSRLKGFEFSLAHEVFTP